MDLRIAVAEIRYSAALVETAVSDVEDRIGMVLAETYKITGYVSEELLGHVYTGRDLVHDRAVQIKILHDHLGKEDPRFGRFLREVRASSMVRHVNTIEMLDSGSDLGLHYIVMEYFASRSLEEELSGGTLPFHRVAHISAQIASAIGAAHQESVTHRALSPRNILLRTDSPRGDFVKVRDFGLSKLELFSDEEESHLTEVGTHVGNTAYMAPEYIERDRFHPKGDLYALGCLMMVMLTGDPPFKGNGAKVLGDHVATPPPRPSERREDTPEWLDDLVLELLAKSPEDRPGAYQVVQRLEEGIGHRLEPPGMGPEVRAPTSKAQVNGKESEGVPKLLLAVVGMALTALAAVMALLLVGAVVLGLSMLSRTPETSSEDVPPITQAPRSPSTPEAPSPVPAAPVVVPPTEVPKPMEEGIPKPDFVEAARRAELKVTSNRRVLVLIDGSPKGMTPLTEPVFPGIHRVAVMLPGKPETKQERKVVVKRGEQSWLVFTF